LQETPRVMICLLVKNDAKHLPQFLNAMKNLDYPKDRLRWIWIYGKSIDDTLSIILEFHKKESYKYEVYEEPVFERLLPNALYVARLCNEFKKMYQGEEYVLFADSDIVEMPPETLKELIRVDKDIVAPYVYRRTSDGKEFFYDTYVFRWHGWKFERVEYKGIVYGYEKPVFANEKQPVELDSVGTFLLIKGEVFKKVDWDNPAPHLQFCKNARKAGYKVWALPYLKIYHADVTQEESPHYSLEWYAQHGMIPFEELSKVGYVKRGGKLVLETW